jgi:hypothetical protein
LAPVDGQSLTRTSLLSDTFKKFNAGMLLIGESIAGSLELLKLFHLMTVILSTRNFVSLSVIHCPEFHFGAFSGRGISLRDLGLFVGIISSDFTIKRLFLMSNDILNHSLFSSNIFQTVAFFPIGHARRTLPLHSITTNCSSSVNEGICCRVAIAMRYFLTTGLPWFLRAIDDSWFNPDNLYTFIRQLSSFLDPFQHVVIKAHMGPDYLHKWGKPFLQGGSPTLMSRAAVLHVLRYFPLICGSEPFPTDDTVLDLIVNRTFTSVLNWADVRFAGAVNAHTNSMFRRQYDLHIGSHFALFNRSCSPKGILLKILKRIVGVHSWGGIMQWRKIVEMASSNWFPEALMFEYQPYDGYQLCVNEKEAARLGSVEYLKRVTPLLNVNDPDLNYSVLDLLKWSLKTVKLPWLPRVRL